MGESIFWIDNVFKLLGKNELSYPEFRFFSNIAQAWYEYDVHHSITDIEIIRYEMTQEVP